MVSCNLQSYTWFHTPYAVPVLVLLTGPYKRKNTSTRKPEKCFVWVRTLTEFLILIGYIYNESVVIEISNQVMNHV